MPSNEVWRCNVMLYSESGVSRIQIAGGGECKIDYLGYRGIGSQTNSIQTVSKSNLAILYDRAWNALNEFAPASRSERFQDTSDDTFLKRISVSLMVGSDKHNTVTLMAQEEILRFRDSQFMNMLTVMQKLLGGLGAALDGDGGGGESRHSSFEFKEPSKVENGTAVGSD